MDFVGNKSNLDHDWHGPISWQELIDHRHIRDIQDTFTVNLCAVAALTLVLYDMILCFEQEVSLVWWRWRKPKGRHSRRIYVIVRYFSILNLVWYVLINTTKDLSQSFCQVWHYIVVINATIITTLPDVMLLIRINAVYGWDHAVLSTCISLIFIQIATGLGIGMLAVLTTGVSHSSIGLPIIGCPLGRPKYHSMITLAAWIPSVGAQGIYFLMMLTTFVHAMQELDSNGKASAESLLQVRRLVPTMIAFISRGSCYLFIAIISKIVNAVIVVSVSGPLQGAGIPIMMALYPVLITRMYLSMAAYLFARPKCTVVHGDDTDMMLVSSSSTLIRAHIESAPITFAVRSSCVPEFDEEPPG